MGRLQGTLSAFICQAPDHNSQGTQLVSNLSRLAACQTLSAQFIMGREPSLS
jgi:hypothetical protein